MALPINKHLEAIGPYVPGKPIEELAREMGIEGAIKLASNENPLGPSPAAVEAYRDAMANLHRYPDAASFDLRRALSRKFDRPENTIVLGNGSDEIMALIGLALLEKGTTVVAPSPGFSTYTTVTLIPGAELIEVPLKDNQQDLAAMAGAVDDSTRIVILNNPHNPTGGFVTEEELSLFLNDLPDDLLVILDEAYIDFATDPSLADGLDYLDGRVPVAALRTFSKAYGLAGLRVGYGFVPPELASIYERIRMPFNVNLPAQVAAVAALGDVEFYQRTRKMVTDGLSYLYGELDRLGLWHLESQANFVMIRVDEHPAKAKGVFDELLELGVIVRPLGSYGLPDHIRVNVGLARENERFISALAHVLKRA